MDSDDIIEALEATAIGRREPGSRDRVRTAERYDYVQWKNRLMLFLENLEGHLTVEDIRSALEDYHG